MESSAPPSQESRPAEKLRLKVVEGNAAGSVIVVEDELVIGRQASGVGDLGSDIEISRRHARIAREADGRYLIEDLGSTNGTYVNGRAVEGPLTLEAGDRIELGASALIVQVMAPTPPSSPVTTSSDFAEAGAAGEPGKAAADAGVEEPGAALPAEADAGGGLSVEVPGPPPLGLRIDIDLEVGEITVMLDDEAGEVRFVEEDGRWRLK